MAAGYSHLSQALNTGWNWCAALNGVQYINDSIATAPERALAALAAFTEPLILLAGGKDKEMVWDAWAATGSGSG